MDDPYYPDIGVNGERRRTEFSYYAVAFYDLLGQQEELKSLEKLPETEVEIERYRTAAQKTAGRVRQFREVFNSVIDGFFESGENFAEYNKGSEFSADFERLLSIRIHRNFFSDCGLIYLRLPSNPAYAVRSLVCMLQGVALMHMGLLASGIAGRGAIEVAVGCNAMPNELYGPALSRVYEMESRRAKSPRILVGEGMFGFLSALERSAGHEPIDQIAKEHAKRLIHMVCRDEDGEQILDYLGPLMAEFGRSTPILRLSEMVSRIAVFAAAERERLATYPKIASRYGDLLKYCEKSRAHWKH